MKNQLFILLLSLFALASCHNKSKNVLLFNSITFAMEDNERIAITITPSMKDRFQSYAGQSSVQIPLFKFIKSVEYGIYIGFPYQTSISKFYNRKDTVNAFRSDTLAYYYGCRQVNGIFLSEYIANLDGNVIYLLADTLFNYEKMSKRLVYETK